MLTYFLQISDDMDAPGVSIKEVIETLSQLLHHHGYTAVSPEVFRKAKFDKPDADQPILDLIFDIFQRFCGPVPMLPLLQQQKKYFVAFVLKELNYCRILRFLTYNNGTSSRELLLAFGFIILNSGVFEKLRREACGAVAAYFTENWIPHVSDALPMTTDITTTTTTTTTTTPDTLDNLIVFRKKLRHVYRELHASLSSYKKMCSRKPHEERILEDITNGDSPRRGVKLKHASVVDRLVYNDLKLQKRLLVTVEKQTVLLKLHMKWMKTEHVFWQWMSSFAEGNDTPPPQASNGHCGWAKVRDSLMVNLIFHDEQYFEGIAGKHAGNVLSTTPFITNSMTRSVRSFCQRKMNERCDYDTSLTGRSGGDSDGKGGDPHGNSDCDSIRKLEERVTKLELQCSNWLSKYAHCSFPSVVKMPSPRR